MNDDETVKDIHLYEDEETIQKNDPLSGAS